MSFLHPRMGKDGDARIVFITRLMVAETHTYRGSKVWSLKIGCIAPNVPAMGTMNELLISIKPLLPHRQSICLTGSL